MGTETSSKDNTEQTPSELCDKLCADMKELIKTLDGKVDRSSAETVLLYNLENAVTSYENAKKHYGRT